MQTIAHAVGVHAERAPERPALVTSERTLSYGELWARACTVANTLRELGVRPGDRVALTAPSTLEFVSAYLGIHCGGATAVPLDATAPPAALAELVRRARARLTFTTVPLEGIDGEVRSFDELAALEANPGATPPHVPPAAAADLLFTTGTSGRRKGVVLTHANLLAAARHINQVIGNGRDDVEVVPLPLNHSFGLGRLRCNVLAGGTVVLSPGFRLPGAIFAAIARHRATGLVGVPTGFAVLLRFGERGLGCFAEQLRYVEIGSAPMPIAHKRQLMQLLPRTRLFMHYGLTEASRSAFTEFHRDRARLDSIGAPAPGVAVEIRGEDGAPRAPGEAGVLWISGPHVAREYWQDPELSEAAFVGGWLRTGDVARMDADGALYLLGRQDDIIKVNGYKVAPEEVERTLEAHPAVREAACVGLEDPGGLSGQLVCAYLVPRGPERPADMSLQHWMAARVERYKVPARFSWIPALPRASSGKLLRSVLRGQNAVSEGYDFYSPNRP